MSNESIQFIFNDSYIHQNDQTIIVDNYLFILIFSILLVIVMVIGAIGNLLVIYVVLNYGRLKTVTNTYLLHLAFSDLIFLIGIPFFITSLINHAWIFGVFLCKLFFLTQGVNQYTSIIILGLLSYDRYLAVCNSSKSTLWRSKFNPNLLLILSWILSFILMVPILKFTSIQIVVPPQAQCNIDFPYSDSLIPYYVFVAYTSTITFIFPLSLMVYFYIKIVKRLKHRVSIPYQRSNRTIRSRRKVSILVLTVISMHICCCSPYWAFQIITTMNILPQISSLLLPMSSITQFLLFVNSATNPILYAFLSETFRCTFKHVFNCSSSTNNNQYLREKHSILSTRHRSSCETNKLNKKLVTVSTNNNQSQLHITTKRITIPIDQNSANTSMMNMNRHSSSVPNISTFHGSAPTLFPSV